MLRDLMYREAGEIVNDSLSRIPEIPISLVAKPADFCPINQDSVERARVALKELNLMRSFVEVTKGFQEQLYIDELTGIGNRRAAYKTIEVFMSHGEAFDLHFLDVDNFKQINDRLGHKVGDSVLVRIATEMSDGLRADEEIFRIGGDEFIILCRKKASVDRRIAEAKPTVVDRRSYIDRRQKDMKDAEGIRERIERLFKYSTTVLPIEIRTVVSLSVGTAHYDPDHPHISIEHLLHEADERMYADKLGPLESLLEAEIA